LDKIRWIIFSVVVIGGFAGLVIFSESTKINVSDVKTDTIQVASKDNGEIGDHIFGNVNAKVTLIEYGDYQCSGCAAQHVKTKAITEQYKDQLRFIFRNYPLTSIHPNAKAAAAAVEAAGLQGKYWEMHNKVYEAQADWESLDGTERTDFFTAFAKDLSIDTVKFASDMASSNVGAKIDFDRALGVKLKVEETPTFYLNGTHIDSSVWGDKAKLTDAINTELTKAGVALPATK